MGFLQIARRILQSAQRAAVRSVLTSLGVLVGTAAVVATLSIGSAAKSRVEELLATPDSRSLYLSTANKRIPGRALIAPVPISDRLTIADYKAIKRAMRNVSAITPRIQLPQV